MQDLIVMKAFASRARDWSDIEGILIRQADQLDRDQVFRDLASLAEAKPGADLVGQLRGLWPSA